MKAYYGKHWSTGKWAAWVTKGSGVGPVEQWGQTEEEAKDKLSEYLRNHWHVSIDHWDKTSANEHC